MADLIKTLNNLKTLKIQGANAVALASLNCLKNLTGPDKKTYLQKMCQAINKLSKIRPTEPLNQNFLKFINYQIKTHAQLNLNQLKKIVLQSITDLIKLNEKNQQSIVSYGQKIVKKKQKIFTHCHSSLVEKILIKAKGKQLAIYQTETRPLFQGRIMAKKLIKAGLNVTMVADSAAEFLISESSGKKVMMDMAILGADALLPNGLIINKIGSYGIGLSCFKSKTPLYIASSLLKFDLDGIIDIEIRPAAEIWPNKPKKLKIINFAFDKVPAEFITRIITEFGIFKPKQIKQLVKKHYPWLYKI